MRSLAILIVIVAITLSGWLVTYAQEPFVQCGNAGQAMCTTCNLFQTVHRMVNFSFQFLLLPLIAVAFIIGGIIIFTSGGSETRLTRGKSILWNTFLGLIIAFSSWVIVDTIIVTIGTGSYPSSWYKYPGCGGAPTSPIDASFGGGGGGGGDTEDNGGGGNIEGTNGDTENRGGGTGNGGGGSDTETLPDPDLPGSID